MNPSLYLMARGVMPTALAELYPTKVGEFGSLGVGPLARNNRLTEVTNLFNRLLPLTFADADADRRWYLRDAVRSSVSSLSPTRRSRYMAGLRLLLRAAGIATLGLGDPLQKRAAEQVLSATGVKGLRRAALKAPLSSRVSVPLQLSSGAPQCVTTSVAVNDVFGEEFSTSYDTKKKATKRIVAKKQVKVAPAINKLAPAAYISAYSDPSMAKYGYPTGQKSPTVPPPAYGEAYAPWSGEVSGSQQYAPVSAGAYEEGPNPYGYPEEQIEQAVPESEMIDVSGPSLSIRQVSNQQAQGAGAPSDFRPRNITLGQVQKCSNLIQSVRYNPDNLKKGPNYTFWKKYCQPNMNDVFKYLKMRGEKGPSSSAGQEYEMTYNAGANPEVIKALQTLAEAEQPPQYEGFETFLGGMNGDPGVISYVEEGGEGFSGFGGMPTSEGVWGGDPTYEGAAAVMTSPGGREFIEELGGEFEESEGLSETGFYYDAPEVFDRICSKNLQLDSFVHEGVRLSDFAGSIPSGEFYRSPLVVARVSSEPLAYFGEVDLGTRPFSVTIGGNTGEGRAVVTLAHEFAHIADKLYKLGLTHEQVHALGIFTAENVFPAYEAWSRHLRT